MGIVCGWLSKGWFLGSAVLPHLQSGRLHKYLVGLTYLHFTKSRISRHGSEPFFQLRCYQSALSLMLSLLTADLFSLVPAVNAALVTVIGNLKYLLLGWRGSWLAGWLLAG